MPADERDPRSSAEALRSAANTQLGLVLGFFQRAESRLALVLTVDLSMLALLTASAPPLRMWNASMVVAALPAGCIVVSLAQIWLGLFPNVEGGVLPDGKTSLVFFGTIARRSEDAFAREFSDQTDESYTRDVLGQIWTNSTILSEKFARLKLAFMWMLVALIPWLVTLMVFASMRPAATSLLK